MIEKVGFNYELICDHCEENIYSFDEFIEAVNYKKKNNWNSIKSDLGNWYDLCPNCSTLETIEEYKGK